MEGKTTHIIALFEMDGARAAVVYGSEGNIADCFDNAVALVADGETEVLTNDNNAGINRQASALL